jgi:hypothetical protein
MSICLPIGDVITKKKGVITDVLIPDVGYTDSIRITKIFARQKTNLLQVLILYPYPYRRQALLSYFYGPEGSRDQILS